MKTVSKSAFKAALLSGLVASGATAGSLWPSAGQTERSMFADRKASAAGDIVTIVVDESANAQSSQSKKSQRENSLDDAMQKFFLSMAPGSLASKTGDLFGAATSGKSSYSGGGAVNNSQSLTARAAVLVTDVLPNGNLVVAGVRLVTFSGETQYVVLHGLVRPDDVTRENTVTSSNVADARVEFFSEGSLTEAQKRGWLGKLYEKLRPF